MKEIQKDIIISKENFFKIAMIYMRIRARVPLIIMVNLNQNLISLFYYLKSGRSRNW